MSHINGVSVPSRIINRIPRFSPAVKQNIRLSFDSMSISTVLTWVDREFIYAALSLDKHVMRLIYHLSLEEQFGQCIREAMASFTISVRDLLLVQERVSLPCKDYYQQYSKITGREVPGTTHRCREEIEEHDEMFYMEEL